MEAGTAFGELGIHGSKRTATLVCEQDTYLVKINKLNYDNIMKYYYTGKME